jgi:hypothetical protein
MTYPLLHTGLPFKDEAVLATPLVAAVKVRSSENDKNGEAVIVIDLSSPLPDLISSLFGILNVKSFVS